MQMETTNRNLNEYVETQMHNNACFLGSFWKFWYTTVSFYMFFFRFMIQAISSFSLMFDCFLNYWFLWFLKCNRWCFRIFYSEIPYFIYRECQDFRWIYVHFFNLLHLCLMFVSKYGCSLLSLSNRFMGSPVTNC